MTTPELHTARQVLAWTTARLARDHGEATHARLDAELLLARALECTRLQVYLDLDRPLSEAERTRMRELVRRVNAGEPTQYALGATQFYGRRFACDARALIPRPETELLVRLVLDTIPRDAASRILDIGTGTGCIAISVALERPNAEIVATDISPMALTLARENAAALGASERVAFREGDLYDALAPAAQFDAIVSNPPYLTHLELAALAPSVRAEPILALDGGEDGFGALRRIIDGAAPRLTANGLLAVELGEGHRDLALASLRENALHHARVVRDYSGHCRFAVAFRTSPSWTPSSSGETAH